MTLTQRTIVSYLLRRHLVTEQSIVEGDLAVADASRRNLNFQVVSERGPSYLVKQGVGSEAIATVGREAALYARLHSSPDDRDLARYLPRFVDYDGHEHILIIEFLRGAESLREFHARRTRFPPALARTLGTALGTLHRLPGTAGDAAADLGDLRIPAPWVLSIHRPNLHTLHQLSHANLQALGILQHFPEFCELLDGLRREWAHESLIHFDLKWDNLLTFAPRARSRGPALRIVDWELAGVGDPCWDIGSVFSGYLSHWLGSIPITGETPPERFLELARYPLTNMHPALRSFWQAYVRRRALNAATAAEGLLRAVRYAAARLVQTVYESQYASSKLTGHAVCSLQLSLNILQRPHQAAVQLLGIPLPAPIRP